MEEVKLIYTIHSKSNFFQRFSFMQYVLSQGQTSINPYTNFGYNLYELISKEILTEASNSLVDKSDEVWVFGVVDYEVEKVIERATEKSISVKYFSVGQTVRGIKPIFKDEVKYDTKGNTQ